MMGVPSCGTAGNCVMGFGLGNTHVVQKKGCAIVNLRATAHPGPWRANEWSKQRIQATAFHQHVVRV